MLVLLKKEDDKYILKMHSTIHNSLVKLTNIIIRYVATDIKAFYLIKTATDSNNKQPNSSANLYEFVAHSTQAKKAWVDAITETTKLDQYANFPRRNGLASVSPTSPPIPEEENNVCASAISETTTTLQISPSSSPILNPVIENRVLPSKERAEELNRELSEKDEEIKRILQEKCCIIEELMGEKNGTQLNFEFPSHSRELVLAAMSQANQLTASVNDILSQSKDLPASQQENVSVSVYALHTILSSLLAQTTELCTHLESKSFGDENCENFYENTKSLDINADKKQYNNLVSASYSDVRKSTNQNIQSLLQSNSLGDIKEEFTPFLQSPFKISSKQSTADKTIHLDAEI